MALRDQPYLPLYVQDYLTDEKLNMCSAESQGVYIKIMCLFHKSEQYGGILLKQKDKQNESEYLNFAHKLAKLLPFDLVTIQSAICELLEEKVLSVDGDFLFQKRMVKDNELSIKRADSGKKGGRKTQDKNKDFAKAKIEANTEYESENENENEDAIEAINVSILSFDEFWDLYDKKVGDKTKLRKKFEAIKESDRQKIKDHIPLYLMSQPDKQYRKDPQTYLNNRSWNDEIIIKNGTNRSTHKEATSWGELAEVVSSAFNTGS